MLVDDGPPLVQSNSIPLHLAGKHRTLGGEDAARLAQAREKLFWEANRIGISLPNLRHARRFEESPAPTAVLDWLRGRLQYPHLRAWMQRMRGLPRWRSPHELLAKPAPGC